MLCIRLARVLTCLEAWIGETEICSLYGYDDERAVMPSSCNPDEALACRVTWLLERVNELACGDVMCLSKATLDSSTGIAQDFAMMRPILDTLLLSPVMPAIRNEGFSRALSAPLALTAEAKLVILSFLHLPASAVCIVLRSPPLGHLAMPHMVKPSNIERVRHATHKSPSRSSHSTE